jgi:hypothetical protein
MRRARLKVSEDAPAGYYHCLSWVVDRQFIPHKTEKNQLVSLMREYEAFCEVPATGGQWLAVAERTRGEQKEGRQKKNWLRRGETTVIVS